MAGMSDETKQKLRDAGKAAWQNPGSRKRLLASINKAWTPERRAKMSAERKKFWADYRALKAATGFYAKPTDAPNP